MVLKWTQYEFICDDCKNLWVSYDFKTKAAAIKHGKSIKKESEEREEGTLKGWTIKGDSVICAECKRLYSEGIAL